MDSKELVYKAIDRQSVERVPLFPPFQGYWAIGQAGMTIRETFENPEKAARAQVHAVEECGFDGVQTLWDWLYPIEALGCQVKIPDLGTIGTRTHVVKEPGDIDRLELPDVDAFYRGKAALRTSELVAEYLGKDHYTTISLPGPFTIAGELRGVENMLYDSLMDEDFVVALLKKATEIELELIDRYTEVNVDAVMIADPTTSGDMIGLEDFEKLSQRHLKEAGKRVKSHGKQFLVHMCGDTSDRLSQIADAGCMAFSCDKMVDVGEAVRTVGDRMAIIGNLDPSGMLYLGNPQMVEEACMELMEKGGRRGYILGAGCEIPIGSDPENIKAMRRAADRF